MNSTEAIREFADKWFPENMDLAYQSMFNIMQRKAREGVISDLTALISEHYYPKEFLLWTHYQEYWHFDIITDMWYSDDDPQLLHEITTDELFNYWKENER